MMRILHLYKDYHPVKGGIENHIKTLAEFQAAAGHDVTVLVCAPGLSGSRCVEDGVTVIRAGRLFTAASMPVSPAFFLALLGQRPDIAHVQSPYPQGEFANMLLGRSKATVITHQADVVRQRRLLMLYGPLWKAALGRADRIIASSPNYIESSPWLRPVREKCRVCPNGIDISRFPFADFSGRDPNLALFIGRHRYYKSLSTLLQAMAGLPQLRLLAPGDGPMTEQWKREAQELGVADRVSFPGPATDAELPKLYRKAGVFVMPSSSRAEAFGIVFLEAMASGLPCISTELGTGTSWVVQDQETGLVVPPSDPEALAGALQRITSDPATAAAMGAAGRKRVETLFTRETMLDNVMAIYEEALGG